MTTIIPIACLKDNYAYLIVAPNRKAAIVDPSETGPVMAAISRYQVELTCILNTHHHWDHVGGNSDLAQRFPGIEIHGHISDRTRIPGQNVYHEHGDYWDWQGIHIEVLYNPGHTMGAISYRIEGSLFTGDTLFGAGCGRLFEGKPNDLYTSLNLVIGALPDDTKLYFGHEYTANNLRFAQMVEPNNRAITTRLNHLNSVSTPSTLFEERETNPFMRCQIPEVIAFAKNHGSESDEPVEVFRVLRQAKDHF
ncbi:MAG: hydroxyacylglutathione hydrolase [Acidobacteria bacterium]|nr:hydroxyacylglutathione hydrolase [Acidobacteriota bacterium]